MKRSPGLDKSICPICFHFYPASLAREEYPFCPDCGSEAMDVSVIPLGEFLNKNSLEELAELRDKWAAATEFRETYKAAKLRRILRVIELKKQFDSNQSKG